MTDRYRPAQSPALPTDFPRQSTSDRRPLPSPAPTGKHLSRRGLLRGLGAVALLGTAAGAGLNFATAARAATATGTLNIPTLLDSTTDSSGTKVFTLSMETGTTEILSGISSDTCGFNQAYLGPVLKVTWPGCGCGSADGCRAQATGDGGA
jgi:suppressor of ftsI/bilirubin oxidase